MMRVFAAATAAAVVGVSAVQLTAGATVSETADRAERRVVSPTPPPPTARETCNSLQYFGWDSRPVVTCYRAIAAERGWWPQTIDAWQGWLVTDPWSVTQGEAMQCWNVRGGELVDPGDPCEAKYQYRRISEDSGFGQMTYVLYGPNGVLCKQHGYCGSASILASPYDSLLPVLLMVELGRPNGGSDPWCFSASARSYHQCWKAPDR